MDMCIYLTSYLTGHNGVNSSLLTYLSTLPTLGTLLLR